ncbi:phosphorylase family protein [Sphingomonas immobilis]|uniref:Phosphorylase n=1 Tax=Sphingomonas immobilis TaxID=3063997 RepID=A0ABT9A0J0_9SPHN|nr:phosphorylase [Sphingomonas sp. CA1-15]MDO7843048.1 phosphorylase [Sphingomonas sp. CA1-15]
MTILVACGLKREAKIIEREDFLVIPGGGDAAGLEAKLEAAIAGETVEVLLSVGIAGALDPSLKPGDIVIGTTPAPFPRESERTVEKLRHLLPWAVVGTIVGSDTIAATIEQKRHLRATTGAIAVDMESHIAARIAERHALPFAIIRTISDAADHVLPPAALVGMNSDGSMALGAVLKSLARDPAQLPALIRTGRDAARAFQALQDTIESVALSMHYSPKDSFFGAKPPAGPAIR